MTRNISDILTEILNEGPTQQLEGNVFVGRVNVRLGGITAIPQEGFAWSGKTGWC
jgi:hypothetical protein